MARKSVLAGVSAVLLTQLGCSGTAETGPGLEVRRDRWHRELESADPRDRLAGVAGLLVQPDQTLERLLAQAAARLPPATRAWSIYLAARRGGAFDPLPWLEDEQAEIRFRAAEAATNMAARAEVRSALERHLEDPEPFVRIACAWALLKAAPHQDALDILVRDLGHQAPLENSLEAALRLTDLYGAFVVYDPLRGARRRDAARAEWIRLLADDPRLSSLEVRVPVKPSSADAVREVRELLEGTRPTGAPRDRSRLLELWNRVMTVRSRGLDVLRTRRQVLAYLIKRLPSEGLLHADYAMALWNDGDAERALEHFSIADRLQPDVPGILIAWGRALEGANLWKEAAALYRRTIELDPSDELPYQELGRVLTGTGQPRGALQILLQAEVRSPEQWQGHRRPLGRILEQLATLDPDALRNTVLAGQ